MRLADLADARVAVWGYGREGRAALNALCRRFPQKRLTLFCGEAEARAARVDIAAIPSVPVGEGSSSDALAAITTSPDATMLAQFDIVIKSPGISPYKSPVPQAEAAGVRFTSGSALWFAEHPKARTICVTGTKGKSTVTALIAHILRKSGKCVALAGNIGLPLLDLLDVGGSDQPREPDWWVIELSSFQTRDFSGAPTVAVINNLFEEHLDWHGTRERYAADKLAISLQARRLVIGAQPQLLASTTAHPQRSVFGGYDGWHVRDNAIWRGTKRVFDLDRSPLRGAHNAQNVCAAMAAIQAALEDRGVGEPLQERKDQGRGEGGATALTEHVATFQPLPHRLQSLGVRDGLEYVNDSISTTPFATIEALRSFSKRPVTVIVGGFERGVDWGCFVEYATKYPPHAIVTAGANGARIVEALCTIESPRFELVSAPTLDKAVAAARALTPAGGAILLSPGAPSFDQYEDYTARGREFARMAGFDPAAIAQIEGLGVA
jgi:UDP-N-acetylmuramoylalanine--D-glutamate ligase